VSAFARLQWPGRSDQSVEAGPPVCPAVGLRLSDSFDLCLGSSGSQTHSGVKMSMEARDPRPDGYLAIWSETNTIGTQTEQSLYPLGTRVWGRSSSPHTPLPMGEKYPAQN